MDLHEARELRKELEAIEAAMRRIQALWEELPTADDLDALGSVAADIACSMASISAEWQSAGCPAGDKLKDLVRPDGTAEDANTPVIVEGGP